MITSEEIKRRLWDGANELRGSMDASRYKDYMLGLMFYKFLSDKTLETFKVVAGEGQLTEVELPAGVLVSIFSFWLTKATSLLDRVSTSSSKSRVLRANREMLSTMTVSPLRTKSSIRLTEADLYSYHSCGQ